MRSTHTLSAIALLVLAMLATQPSRAAQSYDACTGFIDSVPATVSTQGVWCLRRHLSTAITSGAAITVATNNVTIDCNDFRIGGLAAGNASMTSGIKAIDRQNITVRNCNVRGFLRGIDLSAGAGHLVEDNRLDNNLYMGISVVSQNSLVQRNRVYDTGGSPIYAGGLGIHTPADIIDNVVSGVFGTQAELRVSGIFAIAHAPSGPVHGGTVRGNRVTGVTGAGTAHGISAEGYQLRVEGNHIATSGTPAPGSVGIFAYNDAYCVSNTVSGFQTAISTECNAAGNPTP